MKFDAIIIGAGAAGLFCAVEAGKRGRKVLVIEHNAQVGRKILISGGGRCNFTNAVLQSRKISSRKIRIFAKSALARYTPQDFIELVKKHQNRILRKKARTAFLPRKFPSNRRNAFEECREGEGRDSHGLHG